MVDGLVQAASAAGLETDRIDLKVPALARGIGAADGLLCEWATGEATVALMVGARPRFFRTRKWQLLRIGLITVRPITKVI